MSLKLYNANPEWCDLLRTIDKCVPLTKDGKENRPFVGIVLSVNGFNYYAPFTSPKDKHKTMHNQIDFMKINEGEWGAINFNNMIPINDANLKKADLKVLPTDSEEDRNYKLLMANQLSWCKSNEASILAKANKLYWTIVNGKAWDTLARRCCNFKVLETEILKRGLFDPVGDSDERIGGMPSAPSKLEVTAKEKKLVTTAAPKKSFLQGVDEFAKRRSGQGTSKSPTHNSTDETLNGTDSKFRK